MPRTSTKSELKELILLIGFSDLFECCDGGEPLLEEEDTLSLLTVLEFTRYVESRALIPKSRHWLETVLPKLDDKRFRSQVRMNKQCCT